MPLIITEKIFFFKIHTSSHCSCLFPINFFRLWHCVFKNWLQTGIQRCRFRTITHTTSFSFELRISFINKDNIVQSFQIDTHLKPGTQGCIYVDERHFHSIHVKTGSFLVEIYPFQLYFLLKSREIDNKKLELNQSH